MQDYRCRIIAQNSACLQERTSTSERPTEPSTNGAAVPEEKVAEVISGMSPEQQKQLSQIYYFLVQVPLTYFSSEDSRENVQPANSLLASAEHCAPAE